MEYTASNIVTIRIPDGGIARLECHDTLTSTAALAREYAKQGYPHRYVVFAENRESVPDVKKETGVIQSGVYLSCILRPSIYTTQSGLLAHLATVALINALEEHTPRKLGIGWVSDVFCDGVKIGGVSLEGKTNSDYGFDYIIVSFSIDLDKHTFPPRITDMIKKVFESDNNSVAMIIAKNVLERFLPLLDDLKNPSKFMDTYSDKFVQRNRRIRYMSDGKRHSGRILSVDTDGALIVEDKKRILKLSSVSGISIQNKRR